MDSLVTWTTQLQGKLGNVVSSWTAVYSWKGKLLWGKNYHSAEVNKSSFHWIFLENILNISQISPANPSKTNSSVWEQCVNCSFKLIYPLIDQDFRNNNNKSLSSECFEVSYLHSIIHQNWINNKFKSSFIQGSLWTQLVQGTQSSPHRTQAPGGGTTSVCNKVEQHYSFSFFLEELICSHIQMCPWESSKKFFKFSTCFSKSLLCNFGHFVANTKNKSGVPFITASGWQQIYLIKSDHFPFLFRVPT